MKVLRFDNEILKNFEKHKDTQSETRLQYCSVPIRAKRIFIKLLYYLTKKIKFIINYKV